MTGVEEEPLSARQRCSKPPGLGSAQGTLPRPRVRALKRRNTPASAFSLIEVMCAILILGIALVGLTQGITTALSSSKESEMQTMAALFAAGQIETLRAEGILIDGVTESDSKSDSLYRWRETVSPAGLEGLHEVDVVVESSKSGKEIYELKTLLFETPSTTTADDDKSKKSSHKSKKRERER